MIKKSALAILITAICFTNVVFCFAQNDNDGRVLIMRQAQERKKTIVSVEAYLIEDIIELTLSARMYAAKPKFFNITIAGPKIGRLAPKTREMIYAVSTEEEDSILTTELEGGILRTSKKNKVKKAEGTLTKELVKFKIPRGKIIPGGRYRLWIKIEGMQGKIPIQTFKFSLDNLPELIAQQ